MIDQETKDFIQEQNKALAASIIGEVSGVIHDLAIMVDGRFNRLETKVDNLEVKVDNLEVKVDNLEVKVNNLEKDMNILKEDVTTVSWKVDRLDRRIENQTDDLYKRTGDNERDIAALKKSDLLAHA